MCHYSVKKLIVGSVFLKIFDGMYRGLSSVFPCNSSHLFASSSFLEAGKCFFCTNWLFNFLMHSLNLYLLRLCTLFDRDSLYCKRLGEENERHDDGNCFATRRYCDCHQSSTGLHKGQYDLDAQVARDGEQHGIQVNHRLLQHIGYLYYTSCTSHKLLAV